jgi:hypothetical protein
VRDVSVRARLIMCVRDCVMSCVIACVCLVAKAYSHNGQQSHSRELVEVSRLCLIACTRVCSKCDQQQLRQLRRRYCLLRSLSHHKNEDEVLFMKSVCACRLGACIFAAAVAAAAKKIFQNIIVINGSIRLLSATSWNVRRRLRVTVVADNGSFALAKVIQLSFQRLKSSKSRCNQVLITQIVFYVHMAVVVSLLVSEKLLSACKTRVLPKLIRHDKYAHSWPLFVVRHVNAYFAQLTTVRSKQAINSTYKSPTKAQRLDSMHKLGNINSNSRKQNHFNSDACITVERAL